MIRGIQDTDRGVSLRPRTGGARLCSAVLLGSLLQACGGGTAAPPAPGQSRGAPPDLRGIRVALLPFQRVVGVSGDPYAELVFTLTDRGNEVSWILEDEMNEILERSPAMQTRTRGLGVGLFLQAEVDRVGDPLYGELRRLSALVEAEAILLPVQASFEPNPEIEGSAPRVRLSATLVEPRTGRVIWFGIEEGGEFPQGDPRGLASAVEQLARTLLWYVAG